MLNTLSKKFESRFSLKTAVQAFGIACLIVAGIEAWKLSRLLAPKAKEPEDPFLSINAEAPPTTNNPLNQPSYSEVSNSSIFGANKSTTAAPTQPVSNSTTNLKLVAVNESSNGVKLAIIEDAKGQTQDVFGISETVFGAGKLVEVNRDTVKIDRGGRIEVLALADAAGPSGATGAPEANQTDFSVADEEITSALANLPQLLSQARAVPYFRNGASIGMRLFAIKPESLYEKLGLKNGDIILSVNDNSLSDPAQALKLFEQLKTERAINVKLERNSQTSEMRYSIR